MYINREREKRRTTRFTRLRVTDYRKKKMLIKHVSKRFEGQEVVPIDDDTRIHINIY